MSTSETASAFTREHFVSAPDEVFVSRLTRQAGRALFTIALDRQERLETTAAHDELLMTGTLNDGRGGKGVTYAARLRALARGGSVKAEGNALVVQKADEVLLLLAAATDYAGLPGANWTTRWRRRPERSRQGGEEIVRRTARGAESRSREVVQPR